MVKEKLDNLLKKKGKITLYGTPYMSKSKIMQETYPKEKITEIRLTKKPRLDEIVYIDETINMRLVK